MLSDTSDVLTSNGAEAQVRQEIAETIELASHVYRKNTRASYASKWAAFEKWCAARSLDPLAATPEIVATYLQVRVKAGLNPRSASKHYDAIASKLRELPGGGTTWPRKRRPDIVWRVLKGAANEYARPVDKKRAFRLEHYLAIADPARFDAKHRAGEPWIRVARDRALLLLGLTAGLRRSEIAALRIDDLDFDTHPEGLTIRIRRSKTDEDSEGVFIAVWRWPDPSICPVVAMERLVSYVKRHVHEDSYVFLSMQYNRLARDLPINPTMVNRVVKAAATELGLDPDDFGGHSLRSGFVSITSERGATIDEIMNTTRHRSFEQVRDYIQREHPFERNASRFFFTERK